MNSMVKLLGNQKAPSSSDPKKSWFDVEFNSLSEEGRWGIITTGTVTEDKENNGITEDIWLSNVRLAVLEALKDSNASLPEGKEHLIHGLVLWTHFDVPEVAERGRQYNDAIGRKKASVQE